VGSSGGRSEGDDLCSMLGREDGAEGRVQGPGGAEATRRAASPRPAGPWTPPDGSGSVGRKPSKPALCGLTFLGMGVESLSTHAMVLGERGGSGVVVSSQLEVVLSLFMLRFMVWVCLMDHQQCVCGTTGGQGGFHPTLSGRRSRRLTIALRRGGCSWISCMGARDAVSVATSGSLLMKAVLLSGVGSCAVGDGAFHPHAAAAAKAAAETDLVFPLAGAAAAAAGSGSPEAALVVVVTAAPSTAAGSLFFPSMSGAEWEDDLPAVLRPICPSRSIRCFFSIHPRLSHRCSSSTSSS